MEVALHDGCLITVEIHGDGPAVLLPVNPTPIEGAQAEEMRRWGADPALGRTLIEGLSDRYRVIAFDYEGHVQQHPKPPTLTPANIAADFLAIADAAGTERFAYYGYSWLALSGLQLAIRTDRLSALIMGGYPPINGPYKEMLAVTRATHEMAKPSQGDGTDISQGWEADRSSSDLSEDEHRLPLSSLSEDNQHLPLSKLSDKEPLLPPSHLSEWERRDSGLELGDVVQGSDGKGQPDADFDQPPSYNWDEYDWSSVEVTMNAAQTEQFVTLYEQLKAFDDRAAQDRIRCSRLCFAGSDDRIEYGVRWGDVQVDIVGPLIRHREELEALGWDVRILKGLDHTSAMQAANVLPVLRPWLDSLSLKK